MDEPGTDLDGADVVERLRVGGFVAAEAEAAALVERAEGDGDVLGELVERRLSGEPLAWIVGSVPFCGRPIRVDPGVYVPRGQSEAVARRAIERLPDDGVAVDVCTGAGAVAAALVATRPSARVIGTDRSEVAVACARANGVDARLGDLLDPVPPAWAGRVDVVVGVVPYVPTEELGLLHRDALAFEPVGAYDGGPGGLALLRRTIAGAARLLRPGGALVLELGGDQATQLGADLADAGFGAIDTLEDAEGDVRGIEATWEPDPWTPGP